MGYNRWRLFAATSTLYWACGLIRVLLPHRKDFTGKTRPVYTGVFLAAGLDNDRLDVDVGGLLSAEQFERSQQIDATIRALSAQLPLTLTKPLTIASTSKIFDENVKLTILVDSEEINLLSNRDELISLSDVLVISTAAAQQANALFGGVSAPNLDCQIVTDPFGQSLMIPWKATAPVFPGTPPSGNGMNRFEGISEFVLNSQGKVDKHIIRKASWNGQSLQGPTIGQALRALQSTMTNLQKSPIFRGSNALLEQAATAASSRYIEPYSFTGDVLLVDSVQNVSGWVNNSDGSDYPIPVPGTAEWKDYAAAHTVLVNLQELVIPMLSSSQEVSQYFVKNATFLDTKGNTVLQGQEVLSNFFQSLALARKGTGGSWILQDFKVLDWRKRQVSVEYTAANNPLTITGRDIYTLSTTDDLPVIREIRQTELTAATTDGSMALDSAWLMKNLASAVERSSSPTIIAPVIRNLFTDVLFQPDMPLSKKSPRPVTPTAAGNIYYLMSELHERLPTVVNSTTPPAAEYFSDNVELKGYLGETLLRGATTYNRAVGSLLAAIRQALNQKRLILDSSLSSPRVELTPTGRVRVSFTLNFRVPGPISAPLALEVVSDYVIDPQTGLVIQHRLVETRLNGQLTPGDVISRSLAGFFNIEQQEATSRRNSDDLLQTVSEAMSWLRSLSTLNNSNGSTLR